MGKSCLIVNYQQEVFDENYEPNVLDVFRGPKQFNGREITLEIHDNTGDPLLGVNRQVCYNKADCFMLCVAINNRASLDNVERWRTEIRTVCPDTPIMLVATKIDLRNSCDNPITLQEL